MSTEKDLTNDFKLSIADFGQRAFAQISKDYPKIKTICIQLNGDNIYIGQATGVYLPCYYNPDTENNGIELTLLVSEKTDIIKKLKKHIDDSYPNKKLRSFNIFYNGKTGSINICQNMIGYRSMTRCRLFNEFTIL